MIANSAMLTFNEKINYLIDIDAIRQLRVHYSHCLDSNNIDGLEEVFAVDAIVKVTVGLMEGINEIKSGLTNAFQLFDRNGRGKYPFVHAITNHQITLVDHDHAKGSCYLLDFETAPDVHSEPLCLLGLYHDTYQRITGEWRIVETSLDTIWAKQHNEKITM